MLAKHAFSGEQSLLTVESHLAVETGWHSGEKFVHEFVHLPLQRARQKEAHSRYLHILVPTVDAPLAKTCRVQIQHSLWVMIKIFQ